MQFGEDRYGHGDGVERKLKDVTGTVSIWRRRTKWGSGKHEVNGIRDKGYGYGYEYGYGYGYGFVMNELRFKRSGRCK